MLEFVIWEDLAIAIGSFVGLITKIYALQDSRTVWSRTSSLTNIIFYPPSLLAFISLGLYTTFFTTTIAFLIWIGIYLWRSPAEEDWLGRGPDWKPVKVRISEKFGL